MSTLMVLMPPRDPAVHSQEWQLPELPFVLLDKAGNTQRTGRAALALLPRASSTVLLIAARDLLMMQVAVPPLKGPRLRQALPNVVEDQLIQDPQTCHLALDPQSMADGRHTVAAIDRGWLRFLVEGFSAAGHRALRAVPVARCLPLPETHAPEAAVEPAVEPTVESVVEPAVEPVIVCVFGPVMSTAPALLAGDAPEQALSAPDAALELAVVRGASEQGFAVPAEGAAATIAALAGDAPVALYSLSDLPGESSAAVLPGAQPLTLEAIARRALACRFDLCQFEFAAQPWRLDRATLRRLRVPLALVAASLAVAIVGANLQWLMLARQRDAIEVQMTETLLHAFPNTTVVLDPAGQMTRGLQQLRTAAGEPSPDDFLALADGLARSLGPVPANAIAALDYRERRLDVTFQPGVNVDTGLAGRLARNGLAGTADSSNDKWTIRSAS
ncbi:type II secretion system protein GspL [Paraburkholderia denitrificans]|uniref:Type II secretion system protein GspL n=1 Tax=Paraburkholderia denitrificans TaxID=694025 RepID=A0ABW0J2Q1_9BURK